MASLVVEIHSVVVTAFASECEEGVPSRARVTPSLSVPVDASLYFSFGSHATLVRKTPRSFERERERATRALLARLQGVLLGDRPLGQLLDRPPHADPIQRSSFQS